MSIRRVSRNRWRPTEIYLRDNFPRSLLFESLPIEIVLILFGGDPLLTELNLNHRSLLVADRISFHDFPSAIFWISCSNIS